MTNINIVNLILTSLENIKMNKRDGGDNHWHFIWLDVNTNTLIDKYKNIQNKLYITPVQ